MDDVFKHPTAIVETDAIGAGTRIWAYVHILPGATIGPDCNLCDGAYVEGGVHIGRGVTVKNRVVVGEGVTIEDGVFVGPHVVFTNDASPRSPRLLPASRRYVDKRWLKSTRVETGATLGANCTIACGITIGAWAFVAAGSVVTRDVTPFTFAIGNPSRPIGNVCVCAERLILEDGEAVCSDCGRSYAMREGVLMPLNPIQLWPDDPSTTAAEKTLSWGVAGPGARSPSLGLGGS